MRYYNASTKKELTAYLRERGFTGMSSMSAEEIQALAKRVHNNEKRYVLDRVAQDLDPILPDVPAPAAGSGDHIQGWVAWSDRVEEAWSTSYCHGSGRYEAYLEQRSKNGYGYASSQRSKALYSTRTLALKALQRNLVRELAETLLRLEEKIAEED